jgi:oligosaccharide repeat unit polymerase
VIYINKEMRDKTMSGSWIKKVSILLIQIILTGAMLLVYFTSSIYEKKVFLIGNWGIISILMLIWVVISWKIITGKVFSYYGVFFMIALLLHFGQTWTELLAPNSLTYSSLTEFYNTKEINVGYLYSACCLMILHLAAIMAAIANIYKAKRPDAEQVGKKPVNINILSAFGLALFIFSFFPKVIIDIKLYGFVTEGGYLAIYTNPLTGRLWSILYTMMGFFYPSVYILLYCFKEKKRQWNLLYYGVICYCLAYGLLIGNRGIMFMLIVSLILYRHFVYKKYTKRETLILALFAVLVLMLSSTIALIRNNAGNSITTDVIRNDIEGYNLVYSSISEFGGTAMSLLVGMDFVPDILPFGNGITYLASSAIIIPDPLGAFAWLSPYTTFSGVLNHYHTGLGGSFIAEAYYNFGNYGFAFMAILGLIIGKYLTKMDMEKYKNNYSTSIIWASLMYLAILMYERDQFYSITSGLLQYFIYPWVLYWIFKQVIAMKNKI